MIHIAVHRASACVYTWALRITVLKVQSPLISFTLLNTPRRYVSSSLRCNLPLVLGPLGGEWPLSSLGNSLLFRSKLISIHKWRICFPRPSYRSIPFKSGQGLAQALDSTVLAYCELEAQYVPLQVLIIFSFPYLVMHADALCIYVYVSCHGSYVIFPLCLYAWHSLSITYKCKCIQSIITCSINSHNFIDFCRKFGSITNQVRFSVNSASSHRHSVTIAELTSYIKLSVIS